VKKHVFWILPLACALCLGASATTKKSIYTDSRSGQKYHTVKINRKVWMAENLNYATGKSACYGNNPANCAKYGRLYSWDDAMKACPAGWRLPNNEDWQNLILFVGGEAVAGGKLKSKTGWSDSGDGTDAFGFSAVPSGYRNTDGDFNGAGYYGTWWSATEYDANVAYSRYTLYYGDGVVWLDNDKSYLFSVRCLRN